jgi:hypothetical protein
MGILNPDQERKDLAQAERHIAEAKTNIARQRQRIERLRQSGHETDVAESMLHALETGVCTENSDSHVVVMQSAEECL